MGSAIVAEITSARVGAVAAVDAADHHSAEVAFKRALTLARRLVQDSHQNIASGTNNVAAMVLGQGVFARANPLFIKVLMRIDRLGLFNSPIASTARDNLMQTLLKLG